MTTIAYDLPMRDFIAALDETGHVTHTQHRKTHVTLHHNGGRLSHEGVLSVWQVRPASAHFNIDAAGTAAQFVRVNEYAWATGSTEGNQRSISIEMCDQTLAPDWVVSETTWRAAARLAGWLFARVIGYRPTSEFLVRHKMWSATDCAGPHIDKVYSQILAVAQETFDAIVFGVVGEEFEVGAINIVQGDQSDEHWLVELHGNGGVEKTHIKNGQLSEAYRDVFNIPLKKVAQWKIDWFSKTGEIGG